ncbi:mRNA turnover protein 4 homolog [Littorina saxatilis]|uniref:Ribosome assembly factor mrt4 n=1 Tax=Littorina saxatilis TaxID=31220 RepID=A0AAN9AQV0_9CAEN
MPRSKRNKKVALTQTEKKGLALKQKLIEDIRSCAEKYDRIFTFSVHNMRNIHMKDIRSQWMHSKFFFGKNKVMSLALGKGPEDEHLDGLHHLTSHLHGETGLLFTNKKKAEVVKFFSSFRVAEYARSGNVATETVVLQPGPLDFAHSHTIEPQLRQLGLATVLVKGVVTLQQEFEVCKKGEKLTPEKGRILKLFGHTMAEFYLTVTGMWTKDTASWQSLNSSKKGKKAKMEVKEKEEEDEEDDEEEEEMSDT